MLRIRSKSELAAFNAAYSHVIEWSLPPSPGLRLRPGQRVRFHAFPNVVVGKVYRVNVIDWQRVRDAGHSGVIICPWLGDLVFGNSRAQARFSRKYFWYGTWDVASGVIWDVRAIKSLSWLASADDS